jgi:hypothetical protein
MMNMNYRCIHFVARKRNTTTTATEMDTTMTESSSSLNSCLVDHGMGAAAPIQPTLSSDVVDAAIAAAVAVAAADEYEHAADEVNNIASDDVAYLGDGCTNHSPQACVGVGVVDEVEDQFMGDDSGMLSDGREDEDSTLLV